MISPILLATSPLTPVSISSKMIVGWPFAINALIHSIKRAISPPDATVCTGRSDWFLFAANRISTSSFPEGVNASVSASFSSTCACAIARLTSCFSSFSLMPGSTSFRLFVSSFAAAVKVFSSAANCFSKRLISSSYDSFLPDCSCNSSRSAISSSTLALRCFCISEFSRSSRSCTASNRFGSDSVSSVRCAIVSAISRSSIIVLSVRDDRSFSSLKYFDALLSCPRHSRN